ncbi:MAG: hypothetical protein JST22_14290 [Bacteroidetes bacterium]|nr:hypothetical protein [Bacteroidota bacterium]
MRTIPFFVLGCLLAAGCTATYTSVDFPRPQAMVVVAENVRALSEEDAVTVGTFNPGDTVYVAARLRNQRTGLYDYYVTMLEGKRCRIEDASLMTLSDYSSALKDTNVAGTSAGDGHTILTGPRGGYYYINSNGNKTYIGSESSSGGSSTKKGSGGRKK